MRHRRIIIGLMFGLVLFAGGGVSSLIYILARGAVTSLPWLLLFGLLSFGILALAAGIV